MDRLVLKNGSAFFPFVHLSHKQADCFMCDYIYLLADGADGNDGFPGNRGIVKADDQIIVRKGTVFSDQDSQKYIGDGIT